MSVPSATSTNRETLGHVRGLPPSPDRLITFQDGSFRRFQTARSVEHPAAIFA